MDDEMRKGNVPNEPDLIIVISDIYRAHVYPSTATIPFPIISASLIPQRPPLVSTSDRSFPLYPPSSSGPSVRGGKARPRERSHRQWVSFLIADFVEHNIVA